MKNEFRPVFELQIGPHTDGSGDWGNLIGWRYHRDYKRMVHGPKFEDGLTPKEFIEIPELLRLIADDIEQEHSKIRREPAAP